ncbi:hypothetical protein [Crateriforma conspicua]|uniref:hypothetical protein n=1 Tax=Crateriforma conspicua TaxID=2527996 RepID=UPI00118A9698|nr:hypothetical protein [Crateriforma conspicua]QDV65569.1 hypothetical protein Mal65_47410 [Crateriforma conspicua]
MTWQTPAGDRTLTVWESRLFRSSVDLLIDQITRQNRGAPESRLVHTGVSLFDQLSSVQQIAVLSDVTRHLLCSTVTPAELNATNEATVYAVFRNVMDQIDYEIMGLPTPGPLIDGQRDAVEQGQLASFAWRALVSEAYLERFPPGESELDNQADDLFDDDFGLPPLDCDDEDRWDFVIDALADEILWDRDFELSDLVLDVDPARAAIMKQQLGIDNDYYTDIADDPRDEDFGVLQQSLKTMLRQA